MNPVEEAHKKYGFLANGFMDGVNDPLYKEIILSLAIQDAYGIRSGLHVMVEHQRRMQKIFNPIPAFEYADVFNSPEPEYKEQKGYDNPLEDIVKLYSTILTLYDLGYKIKQYQNPGGDGSGLDGRVE